MTPPHNIIVVDLDGTLCNAGHREHLAQAGLWDEFHWQLSEDLPWPDVLRLVKHFNQAGIEVVGLTGRNEAHRQATLRWLEAYEIALDYLIMRPDNDYTPDHELKPALLARHYAAEQIWFILEDRDKVVEAWRNLGYSCWQVRPGGY